MSSTECLRTDLVLQIDRLNKIISKGQVCGGFLVAYIVAMNIDMNPNPQTIGARFSRDELFIFQVVLEESAVVSGVHRDFNAVWFDVVAEFEFSLSSLVGLFSSLCRFRR